MELNRIASHLFWLGTGALDLGAMAMVWWGLRDRDMVLDLFEFSSGQRMHTRYVQAGGVFEELPPGWGTKCREFIPRIASGIDQYGARRDRNEILLQRLKNAGVVPRERIEELGV